MSMGSAHALKTHSYLSIVTTVFSRCEYFRKQIPTLNSRENPWNGTRARFYLLSIH